MKPKYQEKIKNLKSLIEISKLISSTFDLPTLSRLIMEIAKKVIKSEAATLMLLDEKSGHLSWDIALGKKEDKLKKGRQLKLGEGLAGWVAKSGKPLLVNDVQQDERWLEDMDKSTGFKTKSILCVPLKVQGKTIGILEAINKINAPGFDKDDLELFRAYAGQAAVAIENSRLHQALLESQKVEQELQLARRIQKSFLPSSYPRLPGFEFSAYNLPARQVGGDFYDFIPITDTKLAFFIGDVSGKGIPAALYMARVMHEFRFLGLRYEEPARVLQEVNRLLLERPSSGFFITVLYALLDIKQKKISLANAGHLPAILYRGRKAKSIGRISSLPLAITKKIEFEDQDFSLQPHDLFILYTDGLIERANPQGKQLGLKKFMELISSYGEYKAARLNDEIIKRIKVFTADLPPRDDLTLLTLKVL